MAREQASGKDTDKKALWQTYLSKGGTIGKVRNLDESHMESIYSLAHAQFSSGHYEEALRMFRYMALMDHRNPRYFLGMGLALHRMSKDELAIPALSYADRLDQKDPRPSLCMTECFIRLKQRKLAKKALMEAVRRIKKDARWSKELKQAKQLKHYLLEQ